MSTTVLTIYTLIWPVVVLVVLAVISRGFIGEWLDARRRGEDMI